MTDWESQVYVADVFSFAGICPIEYEKDL